MADCRTTARGSAIRNIPGGITNSRWENMYGGDGFWMFPDPSDPDYLYAESQGGYIGRVNRKTHESRGIQPLPLLQRRQTAVQLEHADPCQQNGYCLSRFAIPFPSTRPRADVGTHFAGPDDERSREAETGRIGRRQCRQLFGGDAYDDLRHCRISWIDLTQPTVSFCITARAFATHGKTPTAT